MARDQMSRVEQYMVRGMYLLLKAEVARGGIPQHQFEEWERDYVNDGGGTISPPVKWKR